MHTTLKKPVLGSQTVKGHPRNKPTKLKWNKALKKILANPVGFLRGGTA